MKIKDVEALVGISKANIRFYEKEGLLNPDRNEENNYRDYTEKDVEILQKIKVLRMLGISLPDIRKLCREEIDLSEVIEKRIEEVEQEVKALQETKKVCENILQRDMNITSLDETIFEGDELTWKQRLEEIIERDIVSEMIEKKELNQTIGGMLIWGYFLSAVLMFFIGDFLLQSDLFTITEYAEHNTNFGYYLGTNWAVAISAAVSLACGMGVYFSSSVRVQIGIYHVSIISMLALFVSLARIGEGKWYHQELGFASLDGFTGGQFAIFFIMIAAYVGLLYFLSGRCEKLFTKSRYAVTVMAIVLPIYTVIAYIMWGQWKVPAAGFFIFLLLISLSWTMANTEKKTYNRYYAVVMATRIMNPLALLFHVGTNGGKNNPNEEKFA